jgi:hypothetical protein
MKQLLRFFLFLVTTGVLLTACQKELNFEIGNAKGTLAKDANNNCAPITTNGSYVKNVALAATNYIDVQVNITELGNYIIKTDTVNGYYFYDSSAVAILGVNTFRLKGYGTPVNASIDDFVVSFDGSTCDVSIVVTATPGGGSGAAEFTLMGSPNACANAKQSNNFFATIPTLAAVNHDTIYVDVTATGTYTINATTTPSNGLTFSKSGTFTATGPNQPVILEAVGTPSTAGSIPYTITTTSPASNCGFNLTVQATPGPATFTFNCAAATLNGTYQAGTAMVIGTNYITIPVTVTGAGGSYNITTTSAANNGITFVGAGVLTPTTTSIKLYALPGTPVAQGNFTYNIMASGASCSVQVPYIAGGGASTDSISATINGSFKVFNDVPTIQMNTLLGITSVLIFGDSTGNVNEGISFSAGNATGIIPTNIPYNVNQAPLIIVSGQYTDANNISYSALPLVTNPTPAFTVTLTSITGGILGATGTRVRGTFTGALKEAGGAVIKTIMGGYFDLTF